MNPTSEKDLGITEVRGAKANIPDIQVYGDGDTFALLCKASSKEQGWMKSTKVCNVEGGCIVQVSTQQRNLDSSYVVAEAVTFVPGVHLDKDSDPRRLVPIPMNHSLSAASVDSEWNRRHQQEQYIRLLIEAEEKSLPQSIKDEIEKLKPTL